MKIGVVSDTHGYCDPLLPDYLSGVDAILHAGDVGSEEALIEFGKIKRVYAVRGNVDTGGLSLPPSLALRFEGVQVEILHHLPLPQAELEAWSDGGLLGKLHPERREAFLKTFDEATRVVIFGHSHQPCLVTLGHRLFFNPGSAGEQRFSLPRCFGILEIFPRGLRGAILSLEGPNDKLPPKVWLPLLD